MSKKIRRLIALSLISVSMALATGCGAKGGADKETENGADSAGSAAAGQSENLNSLLGEWVRIASMGEDYYNAPVDICLLYTSPSPRD